MHCRQRTELELDAVPSVAAVTLPSLSNAQTGPLLIGLR
jgi:hypothetical protein